MEGDVIVIRCFGFSRPGLILSSLLCDQCALFLKMWSLWRGVQAED